MRNTSLVVCLSATVLAGAGAPPLAHATLVGDIVTSVFEAPNDFPGDNLWDDVGGLTTSTPLAAVVGPGAEYSVADGVVFADLDGSFLTIGIVTPFLPIVIGDRVSFYFFDLDFSPSASILAVLLVHTDFSGLVWDWTSDSIHVEIPDQSLSALKSLATFEIQASADLQSAAMPEPGALSLLALGALGLGIRRVLREFRRP